MQNLHLKLTSKYPKYNNWHQSKHHNKIHWGVLVVFTLLVFGTISYWTPISLAADTTTPTIPTNLTATAVSLSQINLSWTASTDNVAVAGYKIYRCAGSACAPTTQIVTSAVNSYSDTGLTVSTAYTYAVSAYDAAGNESAQSNSKSAATQSPSATTANHPLEIIQPQPNMDTKNRFYKAYPGLEYNVRLAVIGGAYPFTYELTAAPTGMTINANTGEITWPNPVEAGSPHSVSARVTDQDGTIASMSWTITVTTSEFYFIDAINGSNSPTRGGTGTGTITNPWKEIQDWYCAALTCVASDRDNPLISATSFLYYRNGTYTPHAAENGNRMPLRGAKPIVWLAYPSESPTLNLANAHIVIYGGSGNNSYFDGFEITNMNTNYGIQIGGSNNNVTFRRNIFHKLPSSTGSNNQSAIGISRESTSGSHWAIQNNTFYDIRHAYGIMGYWVNRVLVGDNVFHDFSDPEGSGAAHPIGPKDSTNMWFIRNNNIYNVSDFGIWVGMYNSNPISDIEISFNRVQAGSTALYVNHNKEPIGGKVYVFRNTFEGNVIFAAVGAANGPYYAYNNVIVNNSSSADHIECVACSDHLSRLIRNDNLSGFPTDNIVDANSNLTSGYASYVGTRGYQLSNESDTTPPAIPTSLTATAISSSQINLSWSVSTDPAIAGQVTSGVAGYKIYRCLGSTCTPATQIATSTTNSYSNTGLTASTAYTYAVSAYDAAGNESGKSFSLAITLTQTTPAINSVSENFVNGSSVTINGVNFGSKTQPQPVLWDNFESGIPDTVLNTTPQVGTWLKDSRPPAIYSTSLAHSGTQSSYAAYDGANQWSQFVVNPLPIADKFYQSFWFRYNTTGTSGQLKLMQVHGDSSLGDFAPGIMSGSSGVDWWFSYISTESGANDLSTRANYPATPSPNAWHYFEMILKRSSAGNVPDGTVIIKIDNEVVYNKTNAITRENSVYNWNEISFFHGVTNMGGNTNVFVDDAYLDDLWSRVIIADNPSYANIAHSEIQIPSAWSVNSITITANQGSFTNGQIVYLYVVDENGNVNANGYPITIGLTPDTEPPTTPTNLTATAISSSQINLSWSVSTDPAIAGQVTSGVAGYKIYRCLGSTCTPATQIATSTTNSYSNTGLTASTAYTYAVSAYDAAGNESDKSNSQSATTSSPPIQYKSSDLNQDTKVDQQDLDILKQDLNRTDKPKSDLNQDDIVDSRDLGIMMGEWSR